MSDFSFETDKATYQNMKKIFESYRGVDSGTGTIFKGQTSQGNNPLECFQIKFMKHQNESWFKSDPMYKIYIRKMDCN